MTLSTCDTRDLPSYNQEPGRNPSCLGLAWCRLQIAVRTTKRCWSVGHSVTRVTWTKSHRSLFTVSCLLSTAAFDKWVCVLIRTTHACIGSTDQIGSQTSRAKPESFHTSGTPNVETKTRSLATRRPCTCLAVVQTIPSQEHPAVKIPSKNESNGHFSTRKTRERFLVLL